MGKTRKNNKYRKRNNIASRKQGKINFLKGLRGGATNRLPVPETIIDFLAQWRLFYIGAHGEIDDNMFVVPENTYILNLASAGFPCNINKTSVNQFLVDNPPTGTFERKKVPKIDTILRQIRENKFFIEQLASANESESKNTNKYEKIFSNEFPRSSFEYTKNEYKTPETKKDLNFFVIDPSESTNARILAALQKSTKEDDMKIYNYLKKNEYIIPNKTILSLYRNKGFVIEEINGATYYEINLANLGHPLVQLIFDPGTIKYINDMQGKLSNKIVKHQKIVYILDNLKIPVIRKYDYIKERDEQQKSISFYEPGDILYDTNLIMYNNLKPPLFLMGVYDIPISYNLTEKIFKKNIEIGFYKPAEFSLLVTNPERKANSGSISITQPNADKYHIELMNNEHNILRDTMFNNTGGTASIGRKNMRLSEVINQLPIVPLATGGAGGGGGGAGGESVKRLIIVDACRVPIISSRENILYIQKKRRMSISGRSLPNVPTFKPLNKAYINELIVLANQCIERSDAPHCKINDIKPNNMSKLNTIISTLNDFITTPGLQIPDNILIALLNDLNNFIEVNPNLLTLLSSTP